MSPGHAANIPHASNSQKEKQNKTIKQKQYPKKSNKDFKNDPHQKHLKKKFFLIQEKTVIDVPSIDHIPRING